jgi:tyrosinase
MSDGTLSPGDPVFYLHHSWLDKLWWDWQNLDLPKRYTDMGGPNVPFQVRNPSGPEGPGSSDALRANPGVPQNPTGYVGGTGPEFTDYFGDDGDVTTLNHRIFMAEIYPNLTIADLMDLKGPVVCSEYINA